MLFVAHVYKLITHPVHIGLYFFGESLKLETSTDPDSRYVLMLLNKFCSRESSVLVNEER
jgi:hypothetical protein